MPSMKNMGPACCCCNHLYMSGVVGSIEVRRYDTNGNAPGDPPGYSYEKITDGFSCDFDPAHKIVLVSRGTAPADNNSLYRFNTDLDQRTLLHTMGATERPANVTSDSDNQLAYFVSYDVPTTVNKRLNVVAHDGTGYAYIADLTNTNVNVVRIPIHFCRANGKLYYCSDEPKKLYRINADGTGDTLLATSGHVAGRIDDCTVDNDNSRLYYIDRAEAAGATTDIFSSDLDGAGPAIIYSGLPHIGGGVRQEQIAGVQWSHKHQRLYFWKANILASHSTDTANGWFSIKADGTDEQLHIAAGNGFDWWLIGSDNPPDWRLGCGWENTGASSTA